MSAQAPAFGRSKPRGGLNGAVASFLLQHADLIFRVQRRVLPIINVGKLAIVSRSDDVRELFLENRHFSVTYGEKLQVIMANEPFFLVQDAEAAHDHEVNALHMAVRPADIPALAKATTARAQALLAAADGPVEVVGFARQIAFDVFSDYLGVTAPAGRDLQEVGQRLFEFQFADPFGDADLHAEVVQLSAVMRDHLDALIASRKAQPAVDDALGRCLALQAKGQDGFSDVQIRTALLGLLVAMPQLQLIAALAMEQLLQRPAELGRAQALARSGDNEALAGYTFEALRFDPLAPVIQRRARSDHMIAAGTPRQTTISKDAKVWVAVQSAMRDPRRILEPDVFDPTRPWRTYLHFGDGLHTCFAMAFNRALVPLMLQPLLKRDGLRRATGSRGRLRRQNLIPDQLWVAFDRAH
jgi:cytochrome P450